MSIAQIKTGHRSYSQLKTYASCGEQYRLERLVRVPQTPAYWFVGGKAFHLASEWIDKGIETDPSLAFSRAWSDEFNAEVAGTDVPQDQWRAGGRRGKDGKKPEGALWWMEKGGPQMTADYATWRKNNADWQIIDLPTYVTADDGDPPPLKISRAAPAIEWGATVWFGTTPIKAFIDRVFAMPTGELCVVDLKTGSREPDPGQLGLYAALIKVATGITVPFGAYYMARKGTLSAPADLSRFSEEYWTEQFHRLNLGIENGVFLPNPSMLCDSCSVNQYCKSYGGALADTALIPLEGK